MKSDVSRPEFLFSGDYSCYCSLLQQTFDQMNDDKKTGTAIKVDEEEGKQVKTKELKEILSSLLLIEEQEKSEKIEWDKAQEEDKMMVEVEMVLLMISLKN
ncbi:hypothetical protein R6Q57_024319 [Mikania cordata]